MNNILILTSGKVEKLDDFKNIEGVSVGSFRDISLDYSTKILSINGTDLKSFKLIYFRMVGKSLEVATLVTDYALENSIQIVDKMYVLSRLLPISLGKSLEMKKLVYSGIKIPKTIFGTFEELKFPYVVKSTTGQRAREVWLVKNQDELNELRKKFENNKFYFGQEFIENAERIRVLVIGDKAVGAIRRHTKWNKTETKETLKEIPQDIADLAIKSAKSVNLEIAGIDILINTKTQESYVIEANAAPAWKLINKHCGISVENEIVKYLQTKI